MCPPPRLSSHGVIMTEPSLSETTEIPSLRGSSLERLHTLCRAWAGTWVTSALCIAPAILQAQEKSPPDPANFTVLSQSQVVAADNPTASAVGAAILAQGGSAADAGVATLLTLGVVHPFASGLGGGGFCLYRDAASGEVDALDFRETAPKLASRDMFLDKKGKAQDELSRYGGLAVATPGEPAGLHALHTRHGKLPWRDVIDPVYRLANEGFYVGELLPDRLKGKASKLEDLPDFGAAFAKRAFHCFLNLFKRAHFDLAHALAGNIVFF